MIYEILWSIGFITQSVHCWLSSCLLGGTVRYDYSYVHIGCGAETGGFLHSRSATTDMFTHTRSGHGRICHFLTTKMVWSALFRSGRGKLGLDPFVAERILLPLRPRPATAYVWTHVMNCVEAYFPPSSARVRSRMCERTLSYVHICAERLQSGDGRVLTFLLRYRGYVHTYAERTRSGRGRICHFLRTKMVWSALVRSGRGKLGVGSLAAERILLPLRLRPATAYKWTHVMICVEANFSPASAHFRPRPLRACVNVPLWKCWLAAVTLQNTPRLRVIIH